jgi:hypothetical protein
LRSEDEVGMRWVDTTSESKRNTWSVRHVVRATAKSVLIYFEQYIAIMLSASVPAVITEESLGISRSETPRQETSTHLTLLSSRTER